MKMVERGEKKTQPQQPSHVRVRAKKMYIVKAVGNITAENDV